MLTTGTFSHGQNTSTFAFHCLVIAKHLLLRNTILPLYQAMTNKMCGFLCVRKYASGERINMFFRFMMKSLRFTPSTLALTTTYVRLHGENAISEVSVWLMLVRRNLALPRGLRLRHLQTPSENQISTRLYQYVVSS